MKPTKYLILLRLLLFWVCALAIGACHKDWLEAKPQKSLVVPSTIADYQAILDNPNGYFPGFNPSFNSKQSSLDEIGAGDFFQTTDSYNALSDIERNAYIWAQDIFGNNINVDDWNTPYERIFLSNLVNEGVTIIEPKTEIERIAWSQVKGSAMFFRGYNHYNIAQSFCKPYDKSSAMSDLGIPLRLTSDFNIKSNRASVLETYSSILADLKSALENLPVSAPSPPDNKYIFRPTKAAANAMLSRVYLSMDEYDSALVYADKCLNLYAALIDYNNYTTNLYNPFTPQFVDEIIFCMTLNPYSVYAPFTRQSGVDSTLYNMYDADDLRKTVFNVDYQGIVRFKGSYFGNASLKFSGLATDEVYLIKAECLARRADTGEALDALNTLLQKRWNNAVPFPVVSAIDAEEALRKILDERRKELCFRGLRWTDLRRLNKDPRFVTTLTREIGGQTYTLGPNDSRYVLPIPKDVIQLSGIDQNPR